MGNEKILEQILQKVAETKGTEGVPLWLVTVVVLAFLSAIGAIWALFISTRNSLEKKNDDISKSKDDRIKFLESLIEDHQEQRDDLHEKSLQQLERTVATIQENTHRLSQFGTTNAELTDALRALEMNVRALQLELGRLMK